ncbi:MULTISPECIES: hydantoinase/oxoprolinase family protein [unclassified Chelatococcus]|uniref:hydantoinase/oxoprolinase family protein n=1 Tax=unclassified Chelatococcus TaxID=2638111 RepID=UPI001BD0765C|nr:MULTISPECIES: hydantoinase/oxoprolinase family protein [unclassified Chelatococcus]MBS7701001.1 hydantoinase/oxoprolinase family protein [Chelatococcus sp. YT9]MBX3555534.1 hydantoinase/oxoprolinase family protein [Chelatococcus sp.]
MGLRIGIDIGGTFTDFAVLDPETGSFNIGKVLSTPADPAEAVFEGLRGLMASGSRDMSGVSEVVHATTIATNTVIQRKGPPTALITTRGFRDVILIGRQKRWELYDNAAGRPAPLVPRHHVFEVPERMLWDGSVETELDEAAVRDVAKQLRANGIVAVAVCFLHSYANPDHERRVEAILREEVPEIMVSISSDVSPLYREFERTSTTVMNAYVMPGVANYVERLDEELKRMGVDGPMLIMQSNGGVATADVVKRFPIRIIESGPAAGVLTAARFAPAAGTDNLISFDMGGTTAKLCLVEGGKPLLTSQFEVDMTHLKKGSGLPVSIPAVDLIEIGSGGGSIAKVELGGISIGPESAGSVPGPVCYGRGGKRPTVTDADLTLGYLNPDYFLGGEMSLDGAGAREAIDREIAQPLGLDTMQAVWGIHEIVTQQMAQAARAVTISCGKDPRSFALVPFGGAGPVHGARLARMLGCPKVVFPRAAGVESAVGLLMAETSLDLARTQVMTLDEAVIPTLNALFADLEARAREQMERSGVIPERQRFTASCDMRFAGQGYEIAVDLPPYPYTAVDLPALRQAFFEAYARSYGARTFETGWDVVGVHWRLRATAIGSVLTMEDLEPLEGDVTRAVKGARQVWFPETDGFTNCTVYDRYRLSVGDVVTGPAIVEERESTIVLPPDSTTRVDPHGNLVTELS